MSETKQAEWNVNKTAEMGHEKNLRNLCRQLEQAYVEWKRDATVGGCVIVHEWPAIGECGRYTAKDVRIRFVTTKNRTIQVQTPDFRVIGEYNIESGIAQQLYADAGSILDDEESRDD